MRNKIIFYIFLLTFSGTYSFCQSQPKKKTINLKLFQTGNKVCILYESDSFKIITSANYITNFYKNSKDTTEWFKEEKELFVTWKSRYSDTIDFYKFAIQKSLEHLLKNRSGNFIRKNKVRVINLITRKSISKIFSEPYDDFDVGGEIFFVNKQVLFRTIERIY